MALVRWLGRRRACLPRRRGRTLLKLAAVAVALLLFCEVLIYYLVIFWCRWPEVGVAAQGRREPVLKALFLADTHLLGEVTGHWLDRLRREWQMERAFQTALWLLQPEVVLVLGDVFDEGKWSHSQAWEEDVARFRKMFRHPRHVQLKVVVGNHDIGFHYQMSWHRVRRFEEVFGSDRLFSQKGVNFVMVNSVALEGDGCGICSRVEADLIEVSRKLNCSREKPGSSQCAGGQRLPVSAPILLQHYPLYRASDANCSGEDAAPPEERNVPFQEKYDVLSREASQKLLWWFRPRLILSGHTHSACEVLHRGRVPEISVPSFSWRNRNNPSFIMGSLTSSDFALSKCFLPLESTVLRIYCGAAGLLVVLALSRVWRLASPFYSVWILLRTHRAR